MRIRAARKSAGFAIKELAARLGVRPGRLVAWETGQRQPPVAYLRAVASACGADLSWLLTGERAAKGDVPWEARFARLEEEIRSLRAAVTAIAERRPPSYPAAAGTVQDRVASCLDRLDLERTAREVLPAVLAALPKSSRPAAPRLERALVQALRASLPRVLADFLHCLDADSQAR